MATIKIYPNGLTFGTAGGRVPDVGRGKIVGWSASAARRQVRWLYSVQTELLTGHGYAVTLTLKDCPATAEEFHSARRNWIKRIERLGSIRIHWVIEWQRRKVPHLHAAVYMSEPLPREGLELVLAWLDVCQAKGWTASHKSQDVKEISGAVGWLQYLSKHAGRSIKHYQRMGTPPGWEKTGRLWGHPGDWPTVEPGEFTMPRDVTLRFRRLLDGYLLAQARAAGDKSRVNYLKRRRKAETDPYRSSVLGRSDWVDAEVTDALMDLAHEL